MKAICLRGSVLRSCRQPSVLAPVSSLGPHCRLPPPPSFISIQGGGKTCSVPVCLRRSPRPILQAPLSLRPAIFGHVRPCLLPSAHVRSSTSVAEESEHSLGQTEEGRRVSLKGEVAKLFAQAIETVFPGEGVEPLIALPGNPKFGDYQCNNAMSLFSKMKGKENAPFKNPRDLATGIMAALPESPLIQETSIAGPGFINVKIAPIWLGAELEALVTNGTATWAPPVPDQRNRVVVDFSSPNIAKEMHVGHLRSTILGDSLCRALEFCGADVLRLNHVGDWGTQFGMLIEYLKDQGTEEGGKEISDLQAFYKAAKIRFDEDAEFKTRAQKAVVKLQGGDSESLAMWTSICEVSRREFATLYSRLGVTLQERGESFYNQQIPSILAELADKQVAVENEGALCVFPLGADGKQDKDKTPLICRKSDGGFNYASTDLAALKQRLDVERADWLIYVTDSGQKNHFGMLFESALRAGWLEARERIAPRLDHVGFGLVMGEDGKRFRTRSGEVVRLVDLLDEAKERCLKQLQDRWGGSEEGEGGHTDEELERAAEAMGYGAVKYADLHQNRSSNYTFSFDRMLDLRGNTAVYLLYAHARIASIVRKSECDVVKMVSDTKGPVIQLDDPAELQLALMIGRFPEVVESLLDELAPNRLCEYLYDLSGSFNDFYGQCKVLGVEQQSSRLALCEATAMIMRQSFYILGITPLMRI